MRHPEASLGTLEHAAVVRVPVLMTVAHVAQLLDCSDDTVRRRIADGRLPAVRDGSGRIVVRGDDLRAYVDALQRVSHTPRRRRKAPSRRTYDYLSR